MTDTDFPIHLFLAAAVFGMDLIAAGFVFFVLQRRKSPLAYVIPAFILLAGVASSILVFFNLGQPPN